MSFFATLLALLLEQARPLTKNNFIYVGLMGWVKWVTRNLDAGKLQLAWLAWFVAVFLPSCVALGVHWFLIEWFGWPFAVVWNVVILYFTIGFRQFSHHFTEIRDALESGDEDKARQLLAKWQKIEAHDLPRREIIRHVIEHSVVSAHRHVFGVLAWFSILAAFGLGPAGAVIYRLSGFVRGYWRQSNVINEQPVSEPVKSVALAAWHAIDWLPARITALGFAVVGSFEDAIDSWRSLGLSATGDNDSVILAATAGAINVQLGENASFVDSDSEPVSRGGQVPELAHLSSIVGLVWRSVVLWMVLLALLTLARLLG